MQIILAGIVLYAIYRLITSTSTASRERRDARAKAKYQAQYHAQQTERINALMELIRESKRPREIIHAYRPVPETAVPVVDEEEIEEVEEDTSEKDEAREDMEFWRDHAEMIGGLLDSVKLEQAGSLPGSNQYNKYQSRIVTLEKQLHTADMRYRKAKAKYEAI